MILKTIESKAKDESVNELRVDVSKANPFLETYYTNAGFKNIMQDKLLEEDTIFMAKYL